MNSWKRTILVILALITIFSLVEITASNDATMDGHVNHEGDIIPAPEGGYPKE